jgi:yecA family protein
MNTPIRRLEFDELANLFTALGSFNSPAEMHGMLAGQLSAGRRMNLAEWLQEAQELMDVSTHLSSDDSERLQFVYMATLAALSDEQLGFYPLLPDDEQEMEQRLGSLGLWCQGYLAGFALVEKKLKDLPEMVNDALADLAAIAEVGVNESDDWNEGAEEDYAQIVEYVRLAAMNIFSDYASAENPPAGESGYLSAESLFRSRQLH